MHFEERIQLCAELVIDQDSDVKMELYKCEIVPEVEVNPQEMPNKGVLSVPNIDIEFV